MLFECPNVVIFREQVIQYFEKVFVSPLTPAELILGVTEGKGETRKDTINTILFNASYFIYLANINASNLDLHAFLASIKYIHKIEYEISSGDDKKLRIHLLKWTPISSRLDE